MAVKRSSVKAKKPVSVWRKPVKLDLKDLFFALSRGIVDSATANWGSLAEDATQAIGAIGVQTTPGEIAWTLVCRSIVRAMFDLLGEMMPFPVTGTPPDGDKFLKGVEETVEKEGVVLDAAFFRRPADLPLLKLLEQPIHAWLVAHGAGEPDARCVVRRLPSYFVYALHEEWQKRRGDYERLKGVLDTPFTQASERVQAWERYSARLQRQINEPMFGEASANI